jgi:hypothetical protein
MPNHNYNNYHKKFEEKRQAVEEPAQVIPEVVVPEVTPEVTPVIAPETVAPAAHVEPETVKGVVFNCAKLNVREKPVVGSRVVKIIDAGAELAVTTDESFGNFCKICTASGVEGYCVKDYVRLV